MPYRPPADSFDPFDDDGDYELLSPAERILLAIVLCAKFALLCLPFYLAYKLTYKLVYATWRWLRGGREVVPVKESPAVEFIEKAQDESLPGPVASEVLTLLKDISTKTDLNRDLTRTNHVLAVELENARVTHDDLVTLHAQKIDDLIAGSDLDTVSGQLTAAHARFEGIARDHDRVGVEMEEMEMLMGSVVAAREEREELRWREEEEGEVPEWEELARSAEAATEDELVVEIVTKGGKANTKRLNESSTEPSKLSPTPISSTRQNVLLPPDFIARQNGNDTTPSFAAPAAEPTSNPSAETAHLVSCITGLVEELRAARQQQKRDDVKPDLASATVASLVDDLRIVREQRDSLQSDATMQLAALVEELRVVREQRDDLQAESSRTQDAARVEELRVVREQLDKLRDYVRLQVAAIVEELRVFRGQLDEIRDSGRIQAADVDEKLRVFCGQLDDLQADSDRIHLSSNKYPGVELEEHAEEPEAICAEHQSPAASAGLSTLSNTEPGVDHTEPAKEPVEAITPEHQNLAASAGLSTLSVERKEPAQLPLKAITTEPQQPAASAGLSRMSNLEPAVERRACEEVELEAITPEPKRPTMPVGPPTLSNIEPVVERTVEELAKEIIPEPAAPCGVLKLSDIYPAVERKERVDEPLRAIAPEPQEPAASAVPSKPSNTEPAVECGKPSEEPLKATVPESQTPAASTQLSSIEPAEEHEEPVTAITPEPQQLAAKLSNIEPTVEFREPADEPMKAIAPEPQNPAASAGLPKPSIIEPAVKGKEPAAEPVEAMTPEPQAPAGSAWTSQLSNIEPADEHKQPVEEPAMAITPEVQEPAANTRLSNFCKIESTVERKEPEEHLMKVSTPDPQEPVTPVRLSKQQTKAKIDRMYQEWFDLFDVKQFESTLTELGSSAHHAEIIDSLINISFDRSSYVVERTAHLASHLARNSLVSTADFAKALSPHIESVEDTAIEDPAVYSYLALYISQLVASGAFSLAKFHSLCTPLFASTSLPAVKLLGEVYAATQDLEGAEALARIHSKQGEAVWRSFWPAGKASDDVCADWIEQYGINSISPGLVFLKELRWKLANKSVEVVEAWVEAVFSNSPKSSPLHPTRQRETDPNSRASPLFTRIIAASVFRTVAINTVFANGLDHPVASSPDLIDRQRDRLARLKPFLFRYAAAGTQVQILLAAQSYAAEVGSRAGVGVCLALTGGAQLWQGGNGVNGHYLLLNLFVLCHELAIVETAAYSTWMASTEEAATKAAALAEVEFWLKEIKA
ncbi:hypothetical protein BDK51DRAFT_43517 [Blyttiomyces helicus]|uniref:MI domain-containing protein n=1 Tax=Blyttiomyces helicus TaxID=388810 RepID=A0A4P9WH52_9FUNG|nr:hypothetical protein BDK51DRAFT_43517 [Blyttiomyces helicus]|eukprot:RKO92054.1 hypothetical protein BDK51DRAFT_43517 [Blyttiomyces helicus]